MLFLFKKDKMDIASVYDLNLSSQISPEHL